MADYRDLVKIINKEVLSVKELREITVNELVSEVTETKPDNKHKGLPKYDVRLTNGELYYVYVKKNIFGF